MIKSYTLEVSVWTKMSIPLSQLLSFLFYYSYFFCTIDFLYDI